MSGRLGWSPLRSAGREGDTASRDRIHPKEGGSSFCESLPLLPNPSPGVGDVPPTTTSPPLIQPFLHHGLLCLESWCPCVASKPLCPVLISGTTRTWPQQWRGTPLCISGQLLTRHLWKELKEHASMTEETVLQFSLRPVPGNRTVLWTMFLEFLALKRVIAVFLLRKTLPVHCKLKAVTTCLR